MGLVELAIFIIVIVAIVSVVVWFVRKSGITIPQPVLIALYAIAAVLAILFIAGLAGWGPGIRLR